MKKWLSFAAGLLVCAAVVGVMGFPELPAADPTLDSVVYDVSVRDFLLDNLFALSFFIASMICGALLLCYGLYARVKKELSGGLSDAAGMLGVFVLLTGVWILTDSRFFLVFRAEAGGAGNSAAGWRLCPSCHSC